VLNTNLADSDDFATDGDESHNKDKDGVSRDAAVNKIRTKEKRKERPALQ